MKEIQKATEKLSIMRLNEQERQYYESQQRFLLDENTRHNSMEALKEQAEAAAAALRAAEENLKLAQEKAKLTEEKAKMVEEKAKLAEETAKIAEEKAKSAEEKAKALEREKEEALKRERLAMAKKLKETGLDLSLISNLTGLSIEDIQPL